MSDTTHNHSSQTLQSDPLGDAGKSAVSTPRPKVAVIASLTSSLANFRLDFLRELSQRRSAGTRPGQRPRNRGITRRPWDHISPNPDDTNRCEPVSGSLDITGTLQRAFQVPARHGVPLYDETNHLWMSCGPPCRGHTQDSDVHRAGLRV